MTKLHLGLLLAQSLAFAQMCQPLPTPLQERVQILQPKLAPFLCWEATLHEGEWAWRLRGNSTLQQQWEGPSHPWRGEISHLLVEDLALIKRHFDSIAEPATPYIVWRYAIPLFVLQVGLMGWQGPWKPQPQQLEVP